jgi:iron complex transport system ATP-binding protein
MTAPVLETRGLKVVIGGRDVCAGLDLALHPGECLAVLGRNGAGKSTLLSVLAGLRPAEAGEVLLGGASYATLGPRESAKRRGWLGQNRDDAFAATVLETVLIGRHPHLGRWEWESEKDEDIAREMLVAVGLAGFEERQVHTLSGGERQRLAIATLLTQQAPLCLADEPLTHLDLNHQIAVLDLFAARAREADTGWIMVLHDPGLAARYCERALLLFGDGSHLQGASDDVIDAGTLGRLYAHPLTEIRAEGRRWFIPA